MRPTDSRQMWVLLCVCLYTGLFAALYIYWASPAFSYLGLHHNSTDPLSLSISVLMIVVAARLLGTRVVRFSDFVCWVLFLVTLLPALVIIPLQDLTRSSPLLLTMSIFFSFVAIVWIPRKVRLREATGIRQIPSRQFFTFLMFAYVVLMLIMIATYWRLMSFAGLADVYTQRSAASGSGASIVAVYATAWLQNVFNPLLVAIGLFDRNRRWCLVLGIAGQLLVYSVFAAKSVLIGTLVMIGFFIFVLRKEGIPVQRLIAAVLALMLVVVMAWVLVVAFDLPLSSPAGLVMALVYMRTFALPAAFNGVYASFFEANPLTYYSHINVVGLLVDYPYAEAVGRVIGREIIFLANGSDNVFNANANFWATDGTAALGNGGVLLIGPIVGVALVYANKFVSTRKLGFAATVSLPYLVSLTNGGFFTSLLTGGGILLVLFIAYGIPEQKPSGIGDRSLRGATPRLQPVVRERGQSRTPRIR